MLGCTDLQFKMWSEDCQHHLALVRNADTQAHTQMY